MHARCAALPQYTLELTRTERRGFIRTLRGPERILCYFRAEPFSVRMRWLDEHVKYGESTFVRGEQGDRVRFVPRRNPLGGAPPLLRVDLQTPVIWGEARRPLTDFGLERLLARTLATIEAAGQGVAVSYRGEVPLPLGPSAGSLAARRVHHFRIDYDPELHAAPHQDLYIDAVSLLPAATRITFPDGALDAEYIWDQIRTDVRLTDDDFVLPVERERPAVDTSPDEPPQ